MPTIKTLPSCRIRVFFKDHNPPHIHVATNEDKAKMRIDNGLIISGSLAPKTARAARRWLAANRDYAMAKWREIAEAE